MEHIHLLVSTFDTSNIAVAHNLRSCSRPPSETKTKTSRVETKTKTSKNGLDRSRDQDQVSRPTSLTFSSQQWRKPVQPRFYLVVRATLCIARSLLKKWSILTVDPSRTVFEIHGDLCQKSQKFSHHRVFDGYNWSLHAKHAEAR